VERMFNFNLEWRPAKVEEVRTEKGGEEPQRQQKANLDRRRMLMYRHKGAAFLKHQ